MNHYKKYKYSIFIVIDRVCACVKSHRETYESSLNKTCELDIKYAQMRNWRSFFKGLRSSFDTIDQWFLQGYQV